MRWILKWVLRFAGVLVLTLALFLTPVAYNELACRGGSESNGYASLIANPEHQRLESRTLMTYPEWHIVHAYDDYAKVIETGDPHDFQFFRAVRGFWSSLCALSKNTANHGGADAATKQMVYVIGVSFSIELAAKAAYEETLGRLTTLLRGADHSPLDVLSAKQAQDYAKFLQQIPWYKWDFRRDLRDLRSGASGDLRDRERAIALGTEYAVKASYGDVIAKAVESADPDQLTIRALITGLSADELAGIAGITVIGTTPHGIEIETPRYRAFTHILSDLAQRGAQIVEIAGNDDILLTVTGATTTDDALFSFDRQGYGDNRHLIMVKVTELADTLRALPDRGVLLEHIHDY